MLTEYLEAFQARVSIHKKWDEELGEFLESRNFRKYEESLAEATLSLRALREAIHGTSFPEPLTESIREIESMEDQHLRLKVDYHSKRIQNQEVSKSPILSLELEIMEKIQELIPNND